jgi:hypothetical protein
LHLIREPLRTIGLKEGAVVIITRSKPWGRKARLITHITSTDLGKEEMVVSL